MDRILFVVEITAAAWYLAFVITKMPGPFEVLSKLREWRRGRWHGRTIIQGIIDTWINEVGGTDLKIGDIVNHDGLMDCLICNAPYTAAALLLLHHWQLDLLYLPFSIAGLALWAHGLTGWIGRG